MSSSFIPPPPPPPPPSPHVSSSSPKKEELVTFSSSCTPYKPSLAGSCELPFGFILTPLLSSSSSSSSPPPAPTPRVDGEEKAIPICTTCLSYLNMYNPYDDKTGQWICSFCQSVNYTAAGLLSLSSASSTSSVMNSPTATFQQHTFLSKERRKERLVLVLDGNLSMNEVSSILSSLSILLSQKQDDMEFGLVIFDKIVSIYQLSLRGIASCRVFSASDNSKKKKKKRRYVVGMEEELQGYIGNEWENVLDCLKAYFGVEFSLQKSDNSVKMTATKENVEGEEKEKKPMSRKEMLKLKREERLRRKQQQQQQQQASSATTNHTQTQPAAATPTKPLRKHRKKKHARQYRCTGEALRHALDIATASTASSAVTASSSRILLFTNGAPNTGIANVTTTVSSSLKKGRDGKKRVGPDEKSGGDVIDDVKLSKACFYFQKLGVEGFRGRRNNENESCRRNVCIDVFCSGSLVLGIQAYQSLVSPSDGYALSFPSFATSTPSSNSSTNQQFHSDLAHVLSNTYMSVTNNYTTSFNNKNDEQYPYQQQEGLFQVEDGLGLSNKSDFNQLNGVVVDVRMSSFLTPTHVIGPGTVLEEHDEDDGSNVQVPSSSSLGPMPNEQTIFAQSASMAAHHNSPTCINQPNKSVISTTRTRFMLHRYDPKSTFTYMAQMNDSIPKNEMGRYAFFQFVIRQVDLYGTTISTTIHTHRLPIAQSLQDFINGLQEDVVPVLLGREAVYRCIMGRYGTHDNTSNTPINDGVEDEGNDDDSYNEHDSYGEEQEEVFGSKRASTYCSKEVDEILTNDARNDLDLTVCNISNAYRTLGMQTELSRNILNSTPEEDLSKNNTTEQEQHTISALDFAFPPELSDALRLLHHLRRGPMLGSGPLQSFDDRAIQRNLFLRLPLTDCVTMMAPSLWNLMISAEESDANNKQFFEFVTAPPETLALWDNSIIAADDFSNLYVWSGRSTATAGNPQHDKMMRYCQEFLQEQSKIRFPAPQLHVLREGESMSRRLTARLAPSHGDPPDQQLAHYPALGNLSSEELMALRYKFRFYDPSSDPSFRNWFWSVASTKSKLKKEEGVSLCE